MIIYEDGGLSLSDYIVYLEDAYSKKSEKNTQKKRKIYEPMSVRKFLFSLKNLFEGVRVFRSIYIMHGDIKIENIVYDETSGVARFIVVGSATSKEKLLQEVITAKTRHYRNIETEIRQDSPYAHILTDIHKFFLAIQRRDEDPIIKSWVDLIIYKSDYYMLCLELIGFIKWYYPFLLKLEEELEDKRTNTYSAYISCLTALYELLVKACNSYSKKDGSSEIYSLETLIKEYDALLATLPVYDSTYVRSAVPPPLTGGYNKKNNQKKRKTNKRKINKRKTNKRKIKINK
jgi:serine/threonine protein kinase